MDKTRQVHELVSQGSYYFLSRPRRFGKSLLLSTLKYLFLGRRDLFEGLSGRFCELPQKLGRGGRKAVLLIDKYDKPLIDCLDDLPQAQIREKRYGHRFLAQPLPVVALGINFSSEKKAVAEWLSADYRELEG